jgi:hypothetical protein
MNNVYVRKDLKGGGRGLFYCTNPTVAWTEENTNTSVRISGNMAEIQTGISRIKVTKFINKNPS